MSKRILICGPSGVGKSTLAMFISHSLGIPFVTTSTKPLWEKHGIRDHQNLIEMGQSNPEWAELFQRELLEYRREVLAQSMILRPQGYVADRSPIDNMAYYLMQNTMVAGEERTSNYRTLCAMDLKDQADKIIRIRFKMDYELEDDGKRIANPYFQLMTEGIFEAIFQEDLLGISHNFKPKDILVIDVWDITKRLAMVQDFLEIPNLRKTKLQKWLKR